MCRDAGFRRDAHARELWTLPDEAAQAAQPQVVRRMAERQTVGQWLVFPKNGPRLRVGRLIVRRLLMDDPAGSAADAHRRSRAAGCHRHERDAVFRGNLSCLLQPEQVHRHGAGDANCTAIRDGQC